MNQKIILMILSIAIIICTIILLLIIVSRNENSFDVLIDESEITLKKDNIEVYDNVYLSDVLSFKKGFKLIDDYIIDTNEVGIKKLNITYEDILNDREKKGYLEINIADNTAPYIGIGDHYSHIKDTDFTFYSDVICKDNYDRKVKCEIIGEYDISEIGEKNLKIRAKDSSGNVTEKSFEFRVIERKNVKDTTPVYKNLSDIKVPEDASLMIDVSKWQEDIDWKQVKEAGIDYAMIRLGTQKAVDKDSVLDVYFDKNIKEAQANGIKVGVYYFSYANDIEDAKIQAEWVVEQLKDYNIDLAVSFDWECWKYFNDFEINLHDFNEMGKAFLKIIQDNGYRAINYGSKSYLENIWTIDDEYETWLAHYNEKTTYSKNYIMWQFTDRGKVPGIKGAVDLDFYYNK